MDRRRQAVFGAVLTAAALLALSAAQTRVHGPTQVRDIASGGTALSWHYGALSFGVLAANQCAELSFPAHGVSPGMTVIPGWPPTLPAQAHGIMYAGADVIIVRLCSAQAATVPPLTFSAAAVSWR